MLRWLLLVLVGICITFSPGALLPGVSAAANGLSADSAEASARRLVFGVHPFMPAVELHQRFSPLMEYLAVRIGLPLELKIVPDYTEAVTVCVDAKVDFAFVGPSVYVEIVRQNPRVQPLGAIRGAYPRLRGVIVVRADSPLVRLENLKDKDRRIAFVAPESTMGFQVPLYLLGQAGVQLQDLGGYSFLGNHANVGYAVLAGRFDAGAIKYEMFERLQSQGLRVLAHTPEVVDHLFVVTERVEPPLAEKVKSILQQMDGSPEGRKVLAQLRGDITEIVPVEDADFTALRFYVDYAQRSLRNNREQYQ